ncbi:hypothetical protein FRUB_07006 [Fimbriiglobus ruber]|uniref:Minor tail T domain-containing protein n=1 Tax=Fimbriiglobus ruber TaxID=1908690 RepID=A0A225DKB2_9BACT|nr:hypothetical protein FRUB_07006 [Fimbriiglobus ruber]
MTYAEFVHWYAAYQLDPWGEYREDVRAAVIGAATVGCFASNKVRPSDLMVEWDKPEISQEARIEGYLARAAKKGT